MLSTATVNFCHVPTVPNLYHRAWHQYLAIPAVPSYCHKYRKSHSSHVTAITALVSLCYADTSGTSVYDVQSQEISARPCKLVVSGTLHPKNAW